MRATQGAAGATFRMSRPSTRALWAALTALGLVVAIAPPAAAQGVQVQRTAIERELGILVPATDPVRSRPPDADYYSITGSIIHEPAFFEAVSAKTESGRYGLAGWSAPNSPAGADYDEINGWLSFGLSVTWSSPPTPRKRPAQP
jgi:hypothetical protein